MKKFILAGFFMLLLLPLQGVELVNDKIPGELLMPPSPTPAEKYAVEEFRKFVKAITGKTLPIVKTRTPGKTTVEWLKAASPQTAALSGKTKDAIRLLASDAYIIDADKKGVRLIGRHDRALLYATYHLLKEEGVLFLMPGKENEVIPAKKNFTVKEGVRRFSPVFAYRRVILNGGSGFTPDTYDWITRNGLQFTVGGNAPRKAYEKWAPVYGGGGHDLTNLMLGDRKGVKYKDFVNDLMKKHPEYFGLMDGKRTFGGNPSRGNPGPYCQVCTTHPQVLARMVKTVKGIVNNFAGREYARTFSGDDHTNWCSCPNCQKADGKIPHDRNGRISRRYWLFVNHMAKELLKDKSTDLSLYAMVYQNYRSVPEGLKPDPRVSPIICPHQRCYVHSLNDKRCPSNIEKFKNGMFEPWAASGCKAVTFEYHTNLPGNSTLPIEEPWIEDLKYYHKLGMKGFGLVTRAPDGKTYIARRKYLGENMWRALWQLHYLTACFAWDINNDYEKIYEKISSAYYGKAWPRMKEYRKALRKYLLSSGYHMYYGTPYSLTGNVLDQPGAVNTLEHLLKEAEKAVLDSPLHLKRVRKDKGYFENDWKKYYKHLLERKDNDIAVANRTTPLKIDGLATEKCWEKAVTIHDFVQSDRQKSLPTLPASVKILFDENNLYFFLQAQKNRKGTLRLRGGRNDRKLFTDSHIEIIVSPQSMKGKDYQIAINAAGKAIELLGVGELNRGIAALKTEYAVKDHGKFWTAEVRIPVKELSGRIKPGDLWKINVTNIALNDQGKMEFSSISNGVFHGVPLFRNGIMGKSVKLLENTEFEQVKDSPAPQKNGKKAWLFPEGKTFSAWRFSNSNPGTLRIGKKGETPHAGEHFMRILSKGKYAFIEQRIKLPPRKDNTKKYFFRIMARGNADLLIRLRGLKARYYGNIAAKVRNDRWELVSGEIPCGETSYLVLTIRVNGDIDLDSAALVMVEEEKEEMPDSSKH